MAVRTRRRSNPEGRMSLGQHLIELRKRLVISGLAILAGGIGGWFVAEFVWDRLRDPIMKLATAHHAASINYPTITSAFDVRIQVALMVGIVISSPIWLYQIFAFVVPGMTRQERKYVFGFFFTAVPLFFVGCAVGWFVLPRVVGALVGFAPGQDSSIIDAKYYLDFVIKLILASGIAFVLPVFLVLLDFIGVITAKSILKGWRWAVLAITVFTAIATPATDPFTMLLLAVPMVALYFAAFGISLLHDRAVARKAESLAAGLAGA